MNTWGFLCILTYYFIQYVERYFTLSITLDKYTDAHNDRKTAREQQFYAKT